MRIAELRQLARRRKLDLILVMNQANLRSFTGINCDNAVMSVGGGKVVFWTDFRYVPMVHRVAPELMVGEIEKFWKPTKRQRAAMPRPARIGYEAGIPHSQFLKLQKLYPRAKFVDITDGLAAMRAVKTPDEIAAIRAAEKLNCEIWAEARGRFAAGMTERQMARIIQTLMIERGEGEAFDTIVCVGRNAAECHHEPDDTVWNGREPVLVDMGVKLGGVCSDLTRNIPPKRGGGLYRQVYELVLSANRAAIAAARPGITGRALDKVARGVIKKGGFGKCFGHSLGHGVGYEIHESPYASKRSDTKLKPGMVLTIEPGIYLEDNLGVRIEDMILITADGCEVLSSCATV